MSVTLEEKISSEEILQHVTGGAVPDRDAFVPNGRYEIYYTDRTTGRSCVMQATFVGIGQGISDTLPYYLAEFTDIRMITGDPPLYNRIQNSYISDYRRIG